MPYEYESRRRGYGASSNRTTLGYWVPLAITVTVATAGLVAWIWNERKDSEEYNHHHDDRPSQRPPPGYDGSSYPPGQPPYPTGPPGSYPGPPPGAYDGSARRGEDPSVMTRVQDAFRRTPSPQQFFDQASRRVTAGVAAAGAVVGNALSSIREEKGDYEDHSRWSEEADGRSGRPTAQSSQRAATAQIPKGNRKIVAIVVSAETKGGEVDELSYSQVHTSILSHLPEHITDDAKVFVLIYSPEAKAQSSSSQNNKPPPSLASSYSNIGHEDLQTPGDEADRPLTQVSPQPIQHSQLFEILHTQAQAITEKETMIIPFSTRSGYVQILRQIGPQVVYVQANLSGERGESVKNISGWVGQVILVVGDDSGHGGLVDSEDERVVHGDDVQDRWWTNDPRIGLGQIEVVEGLRFGEDWRRRVRGHD